jgi:hypothetical protein
MGIRRVTVTPTIDTAIYAAGDALGGLLEFEDARTPYARSGIICGAQLKDKHKLNQLIYLVLFDRTFTPTADQAAFDPSDADLINQVCVLRFEAADYASFNDSSVAMLGFDSLAVSVPFVLAEGGTSLFGQLYLGAGMTPTYNAADDIIVELYIKD